MAEQSPTLLRISAVTARIGLSKPSIYRLIKEGEFPEPVRLSKNAVAWRIEDLVEWEASRPRAAQAADSARMGELSRRRKVCREAASAA